ncbi:hypothetical protein Godav_010650 [Gossypium davidsonii]|uniref:Uncharacterized protein n=1 Tax=Gossypium davidsonii TaxID=34287 RepID=A0A7J8SH52_GOSDV|nr:hypothetical protein [Gossypium davidsonii]
MRDYLRQLKLIEDNLGICGEKISDAKHIAAILNGLPSEFDSAELGAMAGLFMLITSQSTSHGAQGYQRPTEGAFVSTNGSSASVNALLLESMSGFLIQGPLLISLGILSV